MTTVKSFINRFTSLFLLLFHLGCFPIPTAATTTKKRRSPSPSTEETRHKSPSLFSYLKPIFSSFKKLSKTKAKTGPPPSHFDLPYPSSSTRSSQHSITSPPPRSIPIITRKRSSGSLAKSDVVSADPQQPKRLSFSSSFQGGNIFPCPTCGQVFQKSSHLDQHQSTKHAVVELLDGDSARNVVRIIFLGGWKGNGSRSPIIHRVLKIHNGSKIVKRFEEYREAIKAKASRSGRRHERCIADGNELLRFHCLTFVCSLGEGVCGQEWCGVCGIIRGGFSPKLEGISTMGSSERAHWSIPEDMEEEFSFMNVRRAMLLCRVVAGRVASHPPAAHDHDHDKEDGGFDSVAVASRGSGAHREGEELLVFNPRAVLPCFVIIYTV